MYLSSCCLREKRTLTREQMNNTLAQPACQPFTRPRECLHYSSEFLLAGLSRRDAVVRGGSRRLPRRERAGEAGRERDAGDGGWHAGGRSGAGQGAVMPCSRRSAAVPAAGHSHARWVHRQASLATSLPYYNKAARLVPKVPSLPCPLGRLIALGASRPKTLVKGVGPPDDDEKRHAKPLQHPTDRARTARSTAAAPR